MWRKTWDFKLLPVFYFTLLHRHWNIMIRWNEGGWGNPSLSFSRYLSSDTFRWSYTLLSGCSMSANRISSLNTFISESLTPCWQCLIYMNVCRKYILKIEMRLLSDAYRCNRTILSWPVGCFNTWRLVLDWKQTCRYNTTVCMLIHLD